MPAGEFFYYSIKAERARFSSSEKQKIFLFADAIKFLPHKPAAYLDAAGTTGNIILRVKTPPDCEMLSSPPKRSTI